MNNYNYSGGNLNMADGFGNLSSIAWGIVVFGIIIGLGSLILSKFQEQMTAGTSAYNNTGEVLTGVGTLAEMTPILALASVAIVLIGLFLAFRQSGD
jgi:hypothetical protein